ncbi:MAG: hypothetical protein RL557_639 [archaeon]|jgi:hypothetical protein
MKKETIKADLHYHGPIGFQPYWLKVQGYERKNLLREIADACFKRKIGLCAITSDEDEIPLNSIHDRFNWLKENYARALPHGYEYGLLGKNIAIVTRHTIKDSEELFLVSGQTVRTKEKGVTQTEGLTKKGMVDYLVVGTNQIPNHQPLECTINLVHDRGLIGIAEHAFCTAHGGMGIKNLERFLKYIDAVEGHNSQLILPFGKYGRGLNTQAQAWAELNRKNWIATSDGHRIEDAGISNFEFDAQLLDPSSEEKFVKSLGKIVKESEIKNNCHYENPVSWLSWTLKLAYGVRTGKDKMSIECG